MPYRYEELDDKRFQELCQALLLDSFPHLRCLPVGQPDGGRDAVSEDPASGVRDAIVFQVKFSAASKNHADPVGWLRGTILAETQKIQRLRAAGAQRYIIMTNIAASAHLNVGSADRLEAILRDNGKKFKIPMDCWWRADLDRRLDRAPEGLRWAYSEILVGRQAMVALLAGVTKHEKVSRQEKILKLATAKLFADDQVLRFKQAGIERADLSDLFVDVPIRRIAERETRNNTVEDGQAISGGARTLLERTPNRTVILGAPGQGKSTLVQCICQVHRALLLKKGEFLASLPVQARPRQTRITLRIDLKDYAEWHEGRNPFAQADEESQRPDSYAGTIEGFLAWVLFNASGGIDTSVNDVSDIFQRFPTLLALDGLDEVANRDTRARVVLEIEDCLNRMENLSEQVVAIVTARPSFGELAEPNPDHYSYYELLPLEEDLRIRYLRQWARTLSISTQDRRSLEKIFRARSEESHVQELATNPMQLTILLHLIHRRAESLPRDRTGLYRDYVTHFLDREASKDARVAQYRPLLEDITSYLGWYMQSAAEAQGNNGRVSLPVLRRVMRHYMVDREMNTSLVDALFNAMTTRVWVLTSRIQGTFEFDVQPIREFFSARYLATSAPPPGNRFGSPDKFERFREVASRPYWFNVARFMAGFFESGELFALADSLEQLHETSGNGFWPRRLSRTLVQDGALDGQPRALRNAMTILHDSLNLRLLWHDIIRDDAKAYTDDRGAPALSALLRSRIAGDPLNQLSVERAALLSMHTTVDENLEWWSSRARLDTSPRQWLEVGIPLQVGRSAKVHADLRRSVSEDGRAAGLALAAGFEDGPNSDFEKALVRAVADGYCNDLHPTGFSYPADLLRVLHPQRFIRWVPRAQSSQEVLLPLRHADSQFDPSTVRAAQGRIRTREGPWATITDMIPAHKDERRSAALWADVAHSVIALMGKCWLALELAIIAASAKELEAVCAYARNGSAFGEVIDPRVLIEDIQKSRMSLNWWTSQFSEASGALGYAAWGLAALAAAPEPVLLHILQDVEAVLFTLPVDLRHAVYIASRRIGAAGTGRRVDPTFIAKAGKVSAYAAALTAHHVDPDHRWKVLQYCHHPSDIARIAADTALSEPIISSAFRTRNGLELLHSTFENVAISGPDYRSTAGTTQIKLPREAAEAVLARPDAYPWSLVSLVEGTLSATDSRCPLLDTAEANHWFDWDAEL